MPLCPHHPFVRAFRWVRAEDPFAALQADREKYADLWRDSPQHFCEKCEVWVTGSVCVVDRV